MIVVLLAGPATYAAAACVGWSHSPAERMACCEAAAGQCAAISADDCCAAGEQRRNLESVAVVASVPDDQSVASLIAPPPTRRTFETVHRAVSGRPATYLLDSVFLI